MSRHTPIPTVEDEPHVSPEAAQRAEGRPAPSSPGGSPLGSAAPHHHHDHSHGDHDHSGHRHAPGSVMSHDRSSAFRPPFSLLRLSLAGRLAIALGLSAGIWSAALWAMNGGR